MQAENSRLAIASRRPVLDVIEELVAEAGDLLAPDVLHQLAAGRARVAHARFNVAVLGEFKRGKSVLINALLEREVLPTGRRSSTNFRTPPRRSSVCA